MPLISEMKNLYCVLFLLLSVFVFAQQDDTNAVEVNFMRGNVIPHSPELYQLITGHPEGVMISLSKQTHGKEAWQSLYNFPDYGVYFLYEDFKNDILGKNYAVGAHYNFYFLNRNLMFKIAQGLGMTTHPYDKVTNSKNRAFGSKFMGNTDFFLNYRKENLLGGFGLEAGLFFTHFSNGRIKSPNSGINTYGINLGVNYKLDTSPRIIQDSVTPIVKFTEPIRYNFVFRSGINESLTIGSGQKPFYHIGFYADKRISRKSALQIGTDVFLTQSLKEYIKYKSEAFPEEHIDPNTDYKRVGIFIGHELFINRISLEAQIGYYVYRPFKNDIPVYDRLGMKYYLTKNIFTGLSVKTHGFLAEAMEFAVGVRL